MITKEELFLEMEIQDYILEVANLYNEVDTSDLQGIAQVKAKEIISKLKTLWGVK